MESLSRKSKVGASTNSPSLRGGHQSSNNANLYTSHQSSQVVEGYHVPSSVLMSGGGGHQLYPLSPGDPGAHLHQYEELKVLIPEYGSRKALLYSNGHGNQQQNQQQQQQQQPLPSQRRNDVDHLNSSLRTGL